MVQASVAPYPGAPTGYPPAAAQVQQQTTDGLTMSVGSVKNESLAQIKAEPAANAVAANNTGANNTNAGGMVATNAATQMYLQQKKVCLFEIFFFPPSFSLLLFKKFMNFFFILFMF